MAFPRRFKNQLWHVRLANGEVETATADAVAESFRCGLVDARTLVRAVTAPAWEPLADAAELEPIGLIGGGAPATPPHILSDDSLATVWRVRDEELEARAVRPHRLLPASIFFGIVTMVALIGVAVNARADSTSPRQAGSVALAPPKTIPPSHSGGHDRFHPERHVGRLDPATIKRLRELDYTHRMQGFGNRNHRSRVVSPSVRAFSASSRPVSPARAEVTSLSRWDPLNGEL